MKIENVVLNFTDSDGEGFHARLCQEGILVGVKESFFITRYDAAQLASYLLRFAEMVELKEEDLKDLPSFARTIAKDESRGSIKQCLEHDKIAAKIEIEEQQLAREKLDKWWEAFKEMDSDQSMDDCARLADGWVDRWLEARKRFGVK